MINYSLGEIAKILNAEIPNQFKQQKITGIHFDSRVLQPGQLFFAVQGEQQDGHNFVNDAAAKGAIAAVVNRVIAEASIPQFVVQDTVQAMGKLAQTWREQFNLPLIAVTGSSGKTTVKNLIGSILQAHFGEGAEVIITQGNLNNHLGVPMNLCRLSVESKAAVIEMGMNNFNEISYLTRMAKPTIAMVNNAQPAHLAGVGDLAGVARAKGEIFEGLGANGVAVINDDDQFAQYWKDLNKDRKKITFGLNQGDVHASDIKLHFEPETGMAMHFQLHDKAETVSINLPLLGEHNVRNALAASACALAAGIPLSTIARGLQQVQPASGRLQSFTTLDGVFVLDDTYNANPGSVTAALEACSAYTGPKILVFGDMRELGEQAESYHRRIASVAKSCGFHQVFCFGELSRLTAEAFGSTDQAYSDKQKLIRALKSSLKAGMLVLVKGSRSMKMEEVIHALR